MQILLFAAGDEKNGIISQTYPSLSLRYLRGYVRKYADFDVEFTLEAATDFQSINKASPPDLIGISAVTENFVIAETLAKQARNRLGPELPIILGGCHISAIPESLPPVFDAAVIGEGEATFLEILETLHLKGSLTPDDFARIPGVAYFGKKQESYNSETERTDDTASFYRPPLSPPRPQISDIDIIPSPEGSRSVMWLGHMLTSRGCPYSCVYCATHALWGAPRMHSPEYVISEIGDMYRAGIREIILFDDNFLAGRERVKGISRLMQKSEYAGRIKFTCYGRTRAVTEDLTADLIAMGVEQIYLGADSIRDNTLQELRDPGSYEKNGKAIDICHRAGLKVDCSFVIGLPHQTKEDLDRIHGFIEEYSHELRCIQVSPVNLFPGTPLWEYAWKKGKIPEVITDWSAFGHFTHIFDYSPDSYVYLNENMTLDDFTRYCEKFRELTQKLVYPQGGTLQ